MKKRLILLVFIFIGIADCVYLAYERLSNFIPPCSTGFSFINCSVVLRSHYSIFLAIPVVFWGLTFYFALFVLLWLTFTRNKLFRYLFLFFATGGFLFSLYLFYLQAFVIKSYCLYCLVSGLNSLILFVLAQIIFFRERKEISVRSAMFIYRNVAKPILFLFDPEFIHEMTASLAEFVFKFSWFRQWFQFLFVFKPKILRQKINGIEFKAPIGLAAGYDYRGQLTQTTAALGFGFATIGTITNQMYEGNPKPRLGRLPQSKALMVYKGFKNPGAAAIVAKLNKVKFDIPIGISLGRSNSTKNSLGQRQSVADITTSFKTFERSKVKSSYYELNISCPNLFGNVTFYTSQRLSELLTAVAKLHLTKPVFIKMPIELSNAKVAQLLDVIVKYKYIKGVIFGNTLTDRKDPALNREEVRRFKHGGFSGKPTELRSNALIKLAYKRYGQRLTIIGCGGIFNAADAYKKIRLGASLCQLITGMVYEGPQLIARINLELAEFLERDHLSSLSQAVGLDNK